MDSFLPLENNSINIIGIVKGYNESTREVAVYIPKFMPLIPENRGDLSEMTNYGNNTITSSVQYSSQITKSSYIWAMAKNVNEKLPKLESRVLLTFIESNPDLLYWEPFNPNGDYEVIDNEKYDSLYSLSINDVSSKILNDDKINLKLPDGFDCTLVHDKANKELTFKILYNDDSSYSIKKLVDIIGKASTFDYENGELVETPASGIFRRIESIEKMIGNERRVASFSDIYFKEGDIIPANIYTLENDEYILVQEGTAYDPTKKYFKGNILEPSGILEALSLVDSALGYPTSKDKISDKSITERVEDIESIIPAPPSEPGDYSLTCHVEMNGTATYSWKK